MSQPVRRAGLFGVLAIAWVTATTVAYAPTAAADAGTRAYVVSMVDAQETSQTLSHLRRQGRKPTRTFSHVFHGFSARLTPTQVSALRADPDVTAVEPNITLRASTTQTSAPWGLDRIDRRGARNSTYDYSTTGAGVTAYELDTGIRFNHTQFGGRAVSGKNFVDDAQSDASDCTGADALGHGTHVAGIIGGSTYGVAKSARLVSLRVLDCEGEGDLGSFLEALDWIVVNKPAGPAVVNISAGGDQSNTLDRAVQEVIDAGISVVVAAGNEDQSATHISPANAANAITVGSTTTADKRSTFSNYGKKIDIFAPGSGIISAFPTSTTATRTLSGTSMATPFVTGAVARYLQAYPRATPAQVRAALVGDSTKDELSGLKTNSPDRMVYLRRTTTGAATGVTANHSTNLNKMRIRWSAPYGFGATAVTGYRVTRTGTDANGAAFAPLVVSASTRDFAWSKLKDSKYTVSVSPINASGAGTVISKTD